MSSSEVTKKALVEMFEKLAKKTPVDRITASQLTGACGLHRQTFYYHFQDMVDLVEWMLMGQIKEAILSLDDAVSWKQELDRMSHYIEAHRDLYTNLSRSQMRIPLDRVLFNALYTGLLSAIKELSKGKSITKQELCFLASFYTTALIGVMRQWLENEPQNPFFDTARRLEILMDGLLEYSVDRFDRSHLQDYKEP